MKVLISATRIAANQRRLLLRRALCSLVRLAPISSASSRTSLSAAFCDGGTGAGAGAAAGLGDACGEIMVWPVLESRFLARSFASLRSASSCFCSSRRLFAESLRFGGSVAPCSAAGVGAGAGAGVETVLLPLSGGVSTCGGKGEKDGVAPA